MCFLLRRAVMGIPRCRTSSYVDVDTDQTCTKPSPKQ